MSAHERLSCLCACGSQLVARFGDIAARIERLPMGRVQSAGGPTFVDPLSRIGRPPSDCILADCVILQDNEVAVLRDGIDPFAHVLLRQSQPVRLSAPIRNSRQYRDVPGVAGYWRTTTYAQ